MGAGVDNSPDTTATVRERHSLSNYWTSRKTKELEEALQEEREYDEWLQRNLKGTDINIRTINGDVIPLSTYVNSKKEATLESLRELVEPYAEYTIEKLNATQRAKSDLRVQREKSTRKTMSVKFMRFSRTFMEFSNYYSGLVDIMKTADNQFGGGVYGSLSLFFSLAATKQQIEDTIVGSFNELRKGLEEMQIYRDVYPNPKLGAMIATIYKETLRYLQRVTKYYKGSGMSRFKRLITPDEFHPEIEGISAQISGVRVYCQALLAQQCRDNGKLCQAMEQELNDAHKKIIGLEQNGKDLKLQNEFLEKQNEDQLKEIQTLRAELGEREGRDQLEKLLQHHGIPDFLEDEHRAAIEKCQANLGLFHDNMYLAQMDLRALQNLPVYRTWHESTTSSILMLSGKQQQSYLENSNGFCWVSKAALELISHHLTRKSFIVYELCQCNAFQPPDYSPTTRKVMMSLISQLLNKCTHILRDTGTFNRLRDIHIHRDSEGRENDISDLTDLFLTILSFLKHHEPIYVVLDRIDRCSNKYSAKRLLKTLLKAVQRSGCRIKVLTVVSGNLMDVQDCLEDLDIERPGSGTFIFKELQQQARAMGEMSGRWG